ncbi:hypothetical protein TNCV_2977691 [Trichonephila clavipes]|nr:hypothetical protein TNCV_2977691 [Trichonephila clavipes]
MIENWVARIEKEFGTVIEDDDGINADTEKELSFEQKLELAITKKISTNQNTIQKSAISKTLLREIDSFEDKRFRGLGTKRDRDKERKWVSGAAKRKGKKLYPTRFKVQVFTGHHIVQTGLTQQLNNSDEYYPKDDDHRHFFPILVKLNFVTDWFIQALNKGCFFEV